MAAWEGEGGEYFPAGLTAVTNSCIHTCTNTADYYEYVVHVVKFFFDMRGRCLCRACSACSEVILPALASLLAFSPPSLGRRAVEEMRTLRTKSWELVPGQVAVVKIVPSDVLRCHWGGLAKSICVPGWALHGTITKQWTLFVRGLLVHGD